jgi:hypothetical protein
VVDDKWLAALDTAIHNEMDRVSQKLTQRVKELAERYQTPMPQIISRVAELEVKVNRHLERMGFSLGRGAMQETAAVREQFRFFAVETKVLGISKTNIAKVGHSASAVGL